MPVSVEQLVTLFGLEGREDNIKLGTYLYNIGKSVAKADPNKDVRELREDRYAFRGGQ